MNNTRSQVLEHYGMRALDSHDHGNLLDLLGYAYNGGFLSVRSHESTGFGTWNSYIPCVDSDSQWTWSPSMDPLPEHHFNCCFRLLFVNLPTLACHSTGYHLATPTSSVPGISPEKSLSIRQRRGHTTRPGISLRLWIHPVHSLSP